MSQSHRYVLVQVIYMEKKRSVTDTHGIRSYEEGHSSLDIGLSPITKSLSTPSIPLATTLLAGSEGKMFSNGCRICIMFCLWDLLLLPVNPFLIICQNKTSNRVCWRGVVAPQEIARNKRSSLKMNFYLFTPCILLAQNCCKIVQAW